jgi:DNA-directed RNA polymerase specialized sigma24 family protein
MQAQESNSHLSRINTLWSLVIQAHDEPGDGACAAQRRLLERYGSAIRRYLLGALRNADAADDLFQEFAFRFLQGTMRGVAPQRGRFRDYVKGVLFHLIANYHKKHQRLPRQLEPDQPGPGVICAPDAAQEQAFISNWRDKLMADTWEALAASDRMHGQNFHAVLRFRADHPELRSQEMAEPLSQLLGKPLTAAGLRKTLERARARFADLLLEEIAQGLSQPTPEEIERELIDLDLLQYCRPALERLRQG